MLNVKSRYKNWHRASSRYRMKDFELSEAFGPQVHRFHAAGDGLELIFQKIDGKEFQVLLNEKDAASFREQLFKVLPDTKLSDATAKLKCIETLALRMAKAIAENDTLLISSLTERILINAKP